MKPGSALHNIALLAFIFALCREWGSAWPLWLMLFIVLPQKVEQLQEKNHDPRT